ncbi:hypothetical protein SprV_0200761500 [Sparganum proliferum]
MQDAGMARKTEEIQVYADRNETKSLFVAVWVIYDPPMKRTAPLLISGGSTLLMEKSRILNRWPKHFRRILNGPSIISDAAIDWLPKWKSVSTLVSLHPLRNQPRHVTTPQLERTRLRCDSG